MIRATVITVLGMILVTSVPMVKPVIDGRDVEISPRVNKVAELPHVELAVYKKMPVTCLEAIQAVFPADKQKIALAIAMAESHCNTNALGHNTNGTTDGGIFQINSIHTDLISLNDRFDVIKNARVALQLSHGGTNWNAWTTYKNNAYLNYL